MPTDINFNKVLGVKGATSIVLPSEDCPPAPAFVDTNSFEFDGTTSYFDGNGVVYSQLDNQTKATFSFWVKPTTSTFRTVFSIANGSATPGEAQVICFLDASNRVRITFGAVTNSLFSEVDSIQVGFWNHVFIAIDLAQGSPALEGRVYIDGIDKTDTVNLSSLTQFDISTGDIYIGDDVLNYQGKFLGYINEFAIWPGEDYRNSFNDVFNLGLPNDLNNLPTNPIGQTPIAPNAWFRMGEVATYDGSQWIMSDVNNCYKLYSTGIAAPPTQPTTDIPLFDNKSFVFNGIDDYIDMGNPASLQITGSLTLSAWIKRDATATASNYVIIGKDGGTSGTRSFLLSLNNSSLKARIGIFKSGSFSVVESTTVISTGVWYHIMGVNDGTDLKIYINGILENTNVGGGGTIDNGTSPFEIGRRATAPANRGFWRGNIDEVGVWNSDQSANASAIGSTIPTDLSTYLPLSWYRMGEDSLYNSGPGLWSFPDNGSGGNNGSSLTLPESARVSDVPT